jgi:hypothetical protein
MHTACPNSELLPIVWAVVKANITDQGRPFETEFSTWWSNEHVPEYVARPGFISGRRLRLVDDASRATTTEHEYLAVYEVESAATFNAALAAGPAWGPWHLDIDRYVSDWERTYYRLLSVHEVDDAPGRTWAIVKADFAGGTAERENEFNEWYTNKHVPELCAHPGFHRAWRLMVTPDGNDLGPRRQQYWGVYEVDSPDHFKAARARRVESGIPPWDGLWADDLDNVEMSHYELIYSVDHQKALGEAEPQDLAR